MQLGIQGKTNLRAADVFKFVFIVLDASKFSDHFSQRVILTGAYVGQITGHQMMY